MTQSSPRFTIDVDTVFIVRIIAIIMYISLTPCYIFLL